MAEFSRDALNTELVEYIIHPENCRQGLGQLLLPTAGGSYVGCEPGVHGINTPKLVGSISNGDIPEPEYFYFNFCVPVEMNREWGGMGESTGAPFLRLRTRVTAIRTMYARLEVIGVWMGDETVRVETLPPLTVVNVNTMSWVDQDFTLVTANLDWFSPGNLLKFRCGVANDDWGGDRDGRIEIGKISIVFLVRG